MALAVAIGVEFEIALADAATCAVAVASEVAVAFELASAFDLGPRVWSHVKSRGNGNDNGMRRIRGDPSIRPLRALGANGH